MCPFFESILVWVFLIIYFFIFSYRKYEDLCLIWCHFLGDSTIFVNFATFFTGFRHFFAPFLELFPGFALYLQLFLRVFGVFLVFLGGYVKEEHFQKGGMPYTHSMSFWESVTRPRVVRRDVDSSLYVYVYDVYIYTQISKY